MRGYGQPRIGDYAAIGDGRSVALVASNGSIDWLTVPDMDSPAMLAAILDEDRGGSFRLAPAAPFEVQRRYVPDTNVVETTFRTASGVVRVTDALNLHYGGHLPWRELARRVEGLAGRVELAWELAPRFGFGRVDTEVHLDPHGACIKGDTAMAGVLAFGVGEPQLNDGAVGGRFTVEAGHRALLGLVAVDGEPLPRPRREDVEARIDHTCSAWQHWLGGVDYDGDWGDAVRRSALTLKLLLHAPTGALAAAPTTSLPEQIGGDRNYDYRFSWLRDSSFALDALLRLGLLAEAHALLTWLLGAVARRGPELRVFYRLDGSAPFEERVIDHLRGYRGSTPVRVGNAAYGQLQLGNYGDLFETVWLYVEAGNRLNGATGRNLAVAADYLCAAWERPDAGIWEMRHERCHFTISKIGCWVALDRAARLAERGQLPSEGAARWRRAADAVRAFIEDRCWSEEQASYLMVASGPPKPGEDGCSGAGGGTFDGRIDASCLLAARTGFADRHDPRLDATIDSLRRGLGEGPFLYRYSGMQQCEGAFVPCSFWLVEALARAGRIDEAAEVMEGALAAANDVGLLSEEVDPTTGELLGNFPQALSHLALVNAAAFLSDARH